MCCIDLYFTHKVWTETVSEDQVGNFCVFTLTLLPYWNQLSIYQIDTRKKVKLTPVGNGSDRECVNSRLLWDIHSYSRFVNRVLVLLQTNIDSPQTNWSFLCSHLVCLIVVFKGVNILWAMLPVNTFWRLIYFFFYCFVSFLFSFVYFVFEVTIIPIFHFRSLKLKSICT